MSNHGPENDWGFDLRELGVDLDARFEEVMADEVNEYDEEAIGQVWKAMQATTLVAQAFRYNHITGGEFVDEIDAPDAYFERVAEASECGVELLARVERNPELEDDLTQLDPALLRKVRRTVPHVARPLGIEVSLPDPDQGGG